MKGTKVDGIYESDPITHPTAKRFEEIPFLSVITKNLKVMDSTAITLCMDHNLPIIVFNLTISGNLKRILEGERIGTLVSTETTVS
jgi:uridylate kinase